MANEIVNKLHYELLYMFLIRNNCFVILRNVLYISTHFRLTVNLGYVIQDCLKGNDNGVMSYCVTKSA